MSVVWVKKKGGKWMGFCGKIKVGGGGGGEMRGCLSCWTIMCSFYTNTG